MRYARFVGISVVVLASFLLPVSCAKKPATSPPAQAGVADEKSGFVIMADLPLWDLADGKLTWKENIPIGDKVSLLGQSAKAVQSEKERDFIKVRRESGKEGWVRAEYVIPRSILAVVTTDDPIVYTDPKNTAATGKTIPKMTVLAIHSDSGGQAFIRVTAYDPVQKTLLKEVFLRNEGVSSKVEDVQSAILFQLAAQTKNVKQKEAFLTSALKDHPGSVFVTQLEDALSALSAAQAAAVKPTEKFFATMVSNDDNVNVRDSPDQDAGKIAATLSKGQRVEVEEKTRDSYAIGEQEAPWYRIKEPAGWVYGAFLSLEE